MIIVRLRGGLGNQLFQYAAGLALAEHHRVDLKLDLYTYTKHTYRKFELGNFELDTKEASRREVHAFTGKNAIVRYLNKRENYLRCPGVFAQPHYHYFKNYLDLPANLYLSGYWQSEKYFNNVHEKVRSQYLAPCRLDKRNQDLIEKIKSVVSVGVHIRRGDYASNQGYERFFGLLPLSYYQESFDIIEEKVDKPHYFVFSDDPDWCRANFRSLGNAEFIDHNKGNDSFKDILLMAHCSHNIIANSTFSWWGAWLNSNKEKIVISPRKWFNKDYFEGRTPGYACRFYNTDDLIPEGWKRI